MRVKVIADGSAGWERFIRRWGLSLLVGEDVLFDTFGSPGVLLSNLRRFGVDKRRIKHIVLSHDDWDHVDGLWDLIPECWNVTVYICPGFTKEVKKRLLYFGVSVVEVREPCQISAGVYSTGELLGESKGNVVYEQSLVLKGKEGLSLLCGCAHPGVARVARQAGKYFGQGVSCVAGGFHLKDYPVTMARDVAMELQGAGVRKVVPMHCTGRVAEDEMSRIFKAGFLKLKEGQEADL